MKKTLKAILTLAIISPMLPSLSFADFKSVYGTDNRVEFFNASPEVSKLADSVVSLWKAASVQQDPDTGTYSLQTNKFGDKLNLCPKEKFREQPMGAFCSGSLVGEDLVMTAGHCVRDQIKCDGTRIVFGFALKKDGEPATTKMGKEDVYTCKKIITRFLGGEPGSVNPAGQTLGPDYALIQLDRKVTGRKPLAINRDQQLRKGDKMMVIGHPVGLPLKIASDAKVRNAAPEGYFVTDLDTFGGNSGSPVFNAKTNLIEGILVRGAEDFRLTADGCNTVVTYSQNGGRGEDVTKVSVLESFIPKLDNQGDAAAAVAQRVNMIIEVPEMKEEFKQRFNVNFQ